jgi:hypothetical protein
MDIEEALRVARALPTPAEASHAFEALPERVRMLESENTLLRTALAFLRGGGKEKRPPLRDRANTRAPPNRVGPLVVLYA